MALPNQQRRILLVQSEGQSDDLVCMIQRALEYLQVYLLEPQMWDATESSEQLYSSTSSTLQERPRYTRSPQPQRSCEPSRRHPPRRRTRSVGCQFVFSSRDASSQRLSQSAEERSTSQLSQGSGSLVLHYSGPVYQAPVVQMPMSPQPVFPEPLPRPIFSGPIFPGPIVPGTMLSGAMFPGAQLPFSASPMFPDYTSCLGYPDRTMVTSPFQSPLLSSAFGNYPMPNPTCFPPLPSYPPYCFYPSRPLVTPFDVWLQENSDSFNNRTPAIVECSVASEDSMPSEEVRRRAKRQVRHSTKVMSRRRQSPAVSRRSQKFRDIKRSSTKMIKPPTAQPVKYTEDFVFLTPECPTITGKTTRVQGKATADNTGSVDKTKKGASPISSKTNVSLKKPEDKMPLVVTTTAPVVGVAGAGSTIKLTGFSKTGAEEVMEGTGFFALSKSPSPKTADDAGSLGLVKSKVQEGTRALKANKVDGSLDAGEPETLQVMKGAKNDASSQADMKEAGSKIGNNTDESQANADQELSKTHYCTQDDQDTSAHQEPLEPRRDHEDEVIEVEGKPGSDQASGDRAQLEEHEPELAATPSEEAPPQVEEPDKKLPSADTSPFLVYKGKLSSTAAVAGSLFIVLIIIFAVIYATLFTGNGHSTEHPETYPTVVRMGTDNISLVDGDDNEETPGLLDL